MSLPLGGPTRAAELRERWRATSLAEVWLRPGDWYHPAVDALAEAVEEDRCPEASAQRLGMARGAAGVGITEALDDVVCLYSSMERPASSTALRSLAIGWVHGRETAPAPSGVRDPATGLPNGDYLAERLRETYGAAMRDGVTASESHCLVVVDVAIDELDAWTRVARSSAVGRTLDQVFGDGHPMAAMSDGVFVVLCERGPHLPRLAQSLRRVVEKNAEILGLAEALRRPTRIWVECLPESYDAAVLVLRQLGR